MGGTDLESVTNKGLDGSLRSGENISTLPAKNTVSLVCTRFNLALPKLYKIAASGL